MAVQPQTPFKEYTANGTTTVFPLDFDCENKDHLIVMIDDAETDNSTWSLNNKQVTFNAAPSAGKKITLQRNTPYRRDRNYQAYDNSFRPDPVNKDFDWIWWKLQELGYADSALFLRIAQEILDRKDGDALLQSQVTSNTEKANTLIQGLATEIFNRISGDQESKRYAKEYTDFMVTREDQNMPIFDGVADNIVITENGDTQRDVNKMTVKNNEYAPVLGSPVILKFNPIMASFLYGISDPTHLDDNLNNFRGLNNPNGWHESNIAIGGVAFGRNNVPFAYLSTALGHDCVAYGVASLVGGAGSCTGNPDDPVASADGVYGYCSLAVGKDTQARGRISNAMGHLNISESRYSSTDGYKCIAGKVLPSHPDYNIHGGEGEEGAAARAHGYESEAYGNFAFAYGSFLKAYNGAQVIGKGVSSSLRGLAMGYGVDRPTLFLEDGATRGETRFGWVGFNTNQPLSKYDWRLQQSDTLSYTIDAQGSPDTVVAFEVKGLLGNNTYGSLHNVIVTHPNAGQPYGTVQYRLNGNEYLTVDQTRKAKFSNAVEAGSEGFVVAGKRVVGGQLSAILNASGSDIASVNSKLNEILIALRAHGLIAT